MEVNSYLKKAIKVVLERNLLTPKELYRRLVNLGYDRLESVDAIMDITGPVSLI